MKDLLESNGSDVEVVSVSLCYCVMLGSPAFLIPVIVVSSCESEFVSHSREPQSVHFSKHSCRENSTPSACNDNDISILPREGVTMLEVFRAQCLQQKVQRNGDKSAVAMLNISRQLGCVFQDMEPPKSSSILRKNSNILKPIRCVRFTKAVVRHAKIRDQSLSLGMILPR